MTRAVLTDNPDEAVEVDGAWLRLSSSYTEMVEYLTDLTDLVVKVAPGAGRGAPGCFIPSLSQIELDGSLLSGLNPDDLDPNFISSRELFPVLHGVAVHECGHAVHTRWTPPEGTPGATLAASLILEEARMEKRHLSRRPADRRWLRAAVRELITAGGTISTDPRGAASAAALVLARIDAGVLDEDDVAGVEAKVEEVLGADTLASLRSIWREAHDVADDDAAAMVALGARWCEAIDEDPEGPDPDAKDGECGSPGSGGSGDDGSTSGGGAGEDDILSAVMEAADEVGAEERERAAAAADEDARRREAAAARASESSSARTAESEASKVFGHGYSPPRTSNALAGKRKPTAAERAEANRLSQAFRKARFRDRSETQVTSVVPPGRLRGRSLVQQSAQRSMGMLPTAEPWKQTVRRHVDQPPLTVGIACDVSGSMSAVTGSVASTAWVVAQAATRAEGKSATVVFGDHVQPVTRPGAAPAEVQEFTAPGGSEAVTAAVDALDGSLNLTNGTGARILFLITDGVFVAPGENEKILRRVKRLRAAGCPVIMINHRSAPKPVRGVETVTITNPDDVGRVIGDVCVRLLGRA